MKNNWPDNLTIQQYLEGSLDKKLMHELEKKALEDPFLADALEGYGHSPATGHGLSMLQRQLHERISHQQENKKVFDLSWQRLSVAAAAAVMFISAGVLFWMNSQLPQNEMAATNKHVEVNLAPVDTLPRDNSLAANQALETRNAKAASANAVRSAERPVVKSKLSAGSENDHSRTAALAAKNVVLSPELDKELPVAATEAREAILAKAVGDDSMRMAARSARQSRLSEAGVSSFSAVENNKAVPLDGWEAYMKYLQESIAKASAGIIEKGTVIVGVTVDRDGKISDLRIEQGLSAPADSLSLQIIRSGPAWRPPANKLRSEGRINLNF